MRGVQALSGKGFTTRSPSLPMDSIRCLSLVQKHPAAAYDCQYKTGVAAWTGNALVPVAWCFFATPYVHSVQLAQQKRVVQHLACPLLSFAFAADENTHHDLVI